MCISGGIPQASQDSQAISALDNIDEHCEHILQYKCSFILLYLYYVDKIMFYIEINHFLEKAW